MTDLIAYFLGSALLTIVPWALIIYGGFRTGKMGLAWVGIIFALMGWSTYWISESGPSAVRYLGLIAAPLIHLGAGILGDRRRNARQPAQSENANV